MVMNGICTLITCKEMNRDRQVLENNTHKCLRENQL